MYADTKLGDQEDVSVEFGAGCACEWNAMQRTYLQQNGPDKTSD